VAKDWFESLTRKMAERDGPAPAPRTVRRSRPRPTIGERAPGFTLPSTRGSQVQLGDLRQAGRALLFFVPYTGG
jgi:hypothetical protein